VKFASEEGLPKTRWQNKVAIEMISMIAWILWGIVGVIALFSLITSISCPDPGARKVWGLQALIWLAGLILTATLPISKFHLLWIVPLGAIIPFAIIQWRLRPLDKKMAEIIRQHLEEKSGGEVWSSAEMRRVFKVYESTSPIEYAKIIQSPEFAGWWVAEEPGVGTVKVIRRADKVKGTLFFKDSPRLYFSWNPD
jgi:hypothetical protein